MEHINCHFEPVQEKEVKQLADILNYYVLYTTASLQTRPLDYTAMHKRLFFPSPDYKSFTISVEGQLAGYCSLEPWSLAEPFSATGYLNIFLEKDLRGKGIGMQAIRFLEEWALAHEICNLISSCCTENYPAISLSRKAGFVRCGHFSRIGRKLDRQLDIAWFQKSFTLPKTVKIVESDSHPSVASASDES